MRRDPVSAPSHRRPAGLLALIAVLALAATVLPAQAACDRDTERRDARPGGGPAWTVLWEDEFDGSGALDPAGWLYDTGTSYPGGPPQWGTGELAMMTDSTDNVFRRDGALHIRALHAGADPRSGWTSGRVETARLDFQPPPGGLLAVEARIRLPDVGGDAAQGYWPAFWMLGAAYRGNYQNWPGVGEIDVMENINGANRWSGTLHCGASPGGPCNEPNGLGGAASGFSGFSPSLQADFHTYRVEIDLSVTPQQIRWYVDGTPRFVLDQLAQPTWSEVVGHGYFVILNVAIGGDWPGAPTAATASGGTMIVDYVRVSTAPPTR